jgi:hypothetical protein
MPYLLRVDLGRNEIRCSLGRRRLGKFDNRGRLDNDIFH